MANIYLDNFDGKCPLGNIEEQISKNREKFFENHGKKQTKKYAPGEVFGHLPLSTISAVCVVEKMPP